MVVILHDCSQVVLMDGSAHRSMLRSHSSIGLENNPGPPTEWIRLTHRHPPRPASGVSAGFSAVAIYRRAPDSPRRQTDRPGVLPLSTAAGIHLPEWDVGLGVRVGDEHGQLTLYVLSGVDWLTG